MSESSEGTFRCIAARAERFEDATRGHERSLERGTAEALTRGMASST